MEGIGKGVGKGVEKGVTEHINNYLSAIDNISIRYNNIIITMVRCRLQINNC